MTDDQMLFGALIAVAVLGVLLVMRTAPGSGPAAYAALIDWLARRAAARRYHQHDHRHARPTRYGRARALARRARTLRLCAATPTPSAVATIPDVSPFIPRTAA